jgi:hypothetical protein
MVKLPLACDFVLIQKAYYVLEEFYGKINKISKILEAKCSPYRILLATNRFIQATVKDNKHDKGIELSLGWLILPPNGLTAGASSLENPKICKVST